MDFAKQAGAEGRNYDLRKIPFPWKYIFITSVSLMRQIASPGYSYSPNWKWDIASLSKKRRQLNYTPPDLGTRYSIRRYKNGIYIGNFEGYIYTDARLMSLNYDSGYLCGLPKSFAKHVTQFPTANSPKQS